MPITPHSLWEEKLSDGSTFDMIFVEGDTFRMGDNADKKKNHLVKLDDFNIGKYPVTQALWKAVMNGANPSHFVGDNHPVERVSWDDITEGFLPRLNEITKADRPKDRIYDGIIWNRSSINKHIKLKMR